MGVWKAFGTGLRKGFREGLGTDAGKSKDPAPLTLPLAELPLEELMPDPAVSASDPGTQQSAQHHLSNRQVAKQGRAQFESLAIKAANGDADALQALPAAATQAREYYRNDKKYLDEAWAVMTVALRDVLTDDVLTEQDETH